MGGDNFIYLKLCTHSTYILARNAINDDGLNTIISDSGSLSNLEVIMIDRNKIKAKPESLNIKENLFVFY